jgi:hypothetical protein
VGYPARGGFELALRFRKAMQKIEKPEKIS